MRFSVIVPVYRTGQYLDGCVRSVLRQSCRDLELILVDDCCPDGCGKLCDEYAAEDPRVRVIHKPENQGLGFARNTGLEAARGEFILFLDSDDWIDSHLLQRCSEAPEADILVFGTTFHYEKNGRREIRLTAERSAVTPREKADVFAMLTRGRIFPYAWNKLYRREFLLNTGVRFEKTHLIEDFLFNIALLPKAGSIRCIPEPLHNYRRPVHETLASRHSEEFFPLAKRKYLLEEAYLTDAQALCYRPLICQSFVKHLVSAVLRNAGLSRKDQKARLSAMLRDPVTKSVMEHYQPEGSLYRLLKRWIVNERTATLLIACKAARLVQK